MISEFVPRLLEKFSGSILFSMDEVFMVMNEIEEICLYFEIHNNNSKLNSREENQDLDLENVDQKPRSQSLFEQFVLFCFFFFSFLNFFFL